MAKTRGNKNSKSAIEQRRREVVGFLADGIPPEQIQSLVGASKKTLWRDLEALHEQCNALPKSLETYQGYREKIRQELEAQKKVVVESPDFSDRERVAALLQINDRLMGLLALAEPRIVERTMSPATNGGTVVLEMRPVGNVKEPVKNLEDDPVVMPPQLDIGKQVPVLTDGTITIDADDPDFDRMTDDEIVQWDRKRQKALGEGL